MRRSKLMLTGIVCAILFLTNELNAQLNIPEASQRAQVTQKIGVTDITIDYGRPSVKKREVWGKLVPYGFND